MESYHEHLPTIPVFRTKHLVSRVGGDELDYLNVHSKKLVCLSYSEPVTFSLRFQESHAFAQISMIISRLFYRTVIMDLEYGRSDSLGKELVESQGPSSLNTIEEQVGEPTINYDPK